MFDAKSYSENVKAALSPIIWILQYQIIFDTNKFSQKVKDFHLIKPAKSVLLKIEIFEVNKNNFCIVTHTQKK